MEREGPPGHSGAQRRWQAAAVKVSTGIAFVTAFWAAFLAVAAVWYANHEAPGHYLICVICATYTYLRGKRLAVKQRDHEIRFAKMMRPWKNDDG